MSAPIGPEDDARFLDRVRRHLTEAPPQLRAPELSPQTDTGLPLVAGVAVITALAAVCSALGIAYAVLAPQHARPVLLALALMVVGTVLAIGALAYLGRRR